MLPTTPIVLLALLSTASARPSLQRRGLPGGVYACTGTNFSGNCQWIAPVTTCHDDGVIQGQANGVMSLGPDQGGYCTTYDQAGCKGNVIQKLVFPGIKDIGQDYASFDCRADAVNATSNAGPDDDADTGSNSRPKIRDLRILARNNTNKPEKPEGFLEMVGRLAKSVFGGH